LKQFRDMPKWVDKYHNELRAILFAIFLINGIFYIPRQSITADEGDHYVYRRFRNAIIDALIIIAFIVAGVILVLFPELTTKVAHALGIGRGADLVSYLSILFFSFIILKLYARIRRLEQLLQK
jgi:hypothetical protein